MTRSYNSYIELVSLLRANELEGPLTAFASDVQRDPTAVPSAMMNQLDVR
jgi:hypothetical protein